jgi:hypothetical protein
LFGQLCERITRRSRRSDDRTRRLNVLAARAGPKTRGGGWLPLQARWSHEGQILSRDDISLRQHHSVLDGVLELANISGPIVLAERANGVWA